MQTMPDNSSHRWYAIRVASNFERSVSRVICGKGIEGYVPVYRERRSRHGRACEIERPLFAGYVFARFDVLHRLPVLTTPGVVHIVGAGRIPVPVDDSELAAVRRMAECGLRVEPWPFVCVGDTVTIESGPLRGLEGTVLEFKGEYRLIVSVTLLQRSVAAEIDRDSVHRSRPARRCPGKALTWYRDPELVERITTRVG